MSASLQALIDQAEQAARARVAEQIAEEEAERNRQIASARKRMDEALAPELWRELGIDFDSVELRNGAPIAIGEFEIAGHAMIATAEATSALVYLRIILAVNDVCGQMIDRTELAGADLNGRNDYRTHNTERVAEALRAAVALAPEARLRSAERVKKYIYNKIDAGTYRTRGDGPIDRTGARAIKDQIARAGEVFSAEQRASLRAELLRFALNARRDQAFLRQRRDQVRADDEVQAAIAEAARQYAAIYAQYEADASAWAEDATGRAWANAPAPLWTVRYGRVVYEADDAGEVYRSEPEQIVTPDAAPILAVQDYRYHTIRRVEYDGGATAITIANVIDLTPYRYGEITTAGAMAYCRTIAAQPAGVYVNIPHGSDYQPPAPPTLSETWPEFCRRVTGHNPPQSWRAALAADDEAPGIPF